MITGLLLVLGLLDPMSSRDSAVAPASVATGDSVSSHDVQVAAGELIRVTSVGTGPAVVFLPNLFGSAFGFRHLLAPLAGAGYRAVVIEPLGTGFSSYPKKADYSLTAQSERVASALTDLGIRDAIVVGHGVGVSIALRLACRHPDRVTGIVAIDGGAIENAASPGIRRATEAGGLLRLMMSPGRLRKQVRTYLVENSGNAKWITAAVVQGYTAGPERDLGAMIDAWNGMVDAAEPQQLADQLATIHRPVRLVVGGVAHKSGIRPSEIRKLRETLPDFAVDSAVASGGLVHEEAPRAVLSAIREVAPLPLSRRATSEVTP